MTLTNYSAAVPVIATADVAGTIRYFEQTLGFEKQWIWGDPPVYGGVKAGGAVLYITHDPDLASAIRERRLTPAIFLWVHDIDSVYGQHRANHAEITEELATRPLGGAANSPSPLPVSSASATAEPPSGPSRRA